MIKTLLKLINNACKLFSQKDLKNKNYHAIKIIYKTAFNFKNIKQKMLKIITG